MAHGLFQARTKAGAVPRCPKGCGKSMVKLVFLQPPTIGNVKHKRGDRLLREAAEMQGLSDISTSPSRPGGSVMDRIRKKYGGHIQPSQLPIAGTAEHLAALTNRTNALNNDDMRNFTRQTFGREAIMGHAYDKNQWQKDESGKVKHVDIPHQNFLPAASVEKVKEKPT